MWLHTSYFEMYMSYFPHKQNNWEQKTLALKALTRLGNLKDLI